MAFTNVQVEAPQSEGGRMPERMVVRGKVVSKEEERVSGCEGRKDGQLCCSVPVKVELRSGPPLSQKLLAPSLKGVVTASCQSCGCARRRTWTVSSLFLEWFYQFFVPEVWK